MKKITTLFLILISTISAAQTTYKSWLEKTNTEYNTWNTKQDWNKALINWNTEEDKVYNQWIENNGFDDEIDINISTPTQTSNDLGMSSDISSFIDGDTSQNNALVDSLQNKIQTLQNRNSDLIKNNALLIASLEKQINTLQNNSQNQDQNQRQELTDLRNRINNLQQQNTSLRQQAKPTNSLPKIKIWAVIVGVANYIKPSSKLNFCDDDAYKMYSFFRSPEGGAVPDSQIALLIDEDATGKKIKSALTNMSKKAGKDDIFLFYYSGHGSPNNLLGRDYSETNSGYVPHSFLKEQLQNSTAKFTYCILDACHSGNVISNTKSIADLELEQNFYTELMAAKKGDVFIVSSKGEETSLETSGKRQGIFSYYFIQGLKGDADYNNDKIISITEAFDFTRKNVMKYSNNKQNPLISGFYNHNLPLSFVRN